MHRPYWLPPALLIVCCTTPAWAQDEPGLKLNAGYARQSDSNLFRLPAGADPVARLGKSSAAEQIGISSAGFKYTMLYSLQRLELDLSLVDYQYQNFSYLSFTAQNYGAAWRWALSPRFTGNLSTDRKQALNSFSDFQGLNVRNLRTNSNTRFDGTYELDSAWRVIGGASKSSQTNDQPLVAEGDFSATSADVGVRYALASGSALSYTVKNASGSYLNRVQTSPGLLDETYTQTDNEIKARWVISDKSTAELSAAHISRGHPNFTQRNYSGWNGGINLNWNATGKTALSAGWVRDLSSYQDISTNFIQSDRFYVGPVWQISSKTTLRLRHEVAQRAYLGSPTGLVATQRNDALRNTTLLFDWRPYDYVTLRASHEKAIRSSSLPDLDYTSNMTALSAQFSF